MRAIKIDVESKSIYEIELKKGLQPIYDVIGNNCTMFEAPIRFLNGDALFCDEEITFRPEDVKGGFSIIGHMNDQPILNNAIIIGSNEEGDSCDSDSTIEYLSERVRFYSRKKPENLFTL
jgi:hypothetical protein